MVHGIEIEPINYNCPECGAQNEVQYTYLESNHAIQARCKCGKWIGNVKYDKRSREDIRKIKIKEWIEKRREGEKV